MSNASDIRAWLKAQAHPCTAAAIEAARAINPHTLIGAAPAEVAAGLGAVTPEERGPIYWSLGLMYRGGILGRIGMGRSLRYFLLREPSNEPLTAAEKRARRNARLREVRIANGGRTREEIRALKEQRSAERRAARKSAAEERAAAREATLKASREAERARRATLPKAVRPKPEPKAAPKPAPVKVQPSARLTPAAPPKPILQQLESVADYIARGGHIERLPTSWEQAA